MVPVSMTLIGFCLSRTVSEIGGDFGGNFHWKSQKKFPPLVFFAPVKGFPWELGIGTQGQNSKTRIMGLTGRGKSSTISSDVWIQYTNVTDGRTDTGW